MEWKGFDRESRDLISEAEGWGWTFRLSSKGHAIGKAPDGRTTMSVTPRQSKARTGRNQRAEFERWVREWTRARAASMAESMTPIVESAEFALLDPADQVMARAAVKKSKEVLEHIAQEDAEPATSADGDVRSVVSRRPWLARMGSNREKAETDYYESETTEEVTYSDGSVEYACRLEGCDYTAPRPHSVASHYRSHVNKGEVSRIGKRVPVVQDAPFDTSLMVERGPRHVEGHRYQPSERLLAALEEFLRDSGATDPTGLAFAALTWFHERPDLDDAETRVREPLTDAQMVAKIRAIVGGRDPETEEALRVALEANASLLERLDAVQEERDELSVRLGEVMEDRDRIRGDLDAWLALAPRPTTGD